MARNYYSSYDSFFEHYETDLKKFCRTLEVADAFIATLKKRLVIAKNWWKNLEGIRKHLTSLEAKNVSESSDKEVKCSDTVVKDEGEKNVKKTDEEDAELSKSEEKDVQEKNEAKNDAKKTDEEEPQEEKDTEIESEVQIKVEEPTDEIFQKEMESEDEKQDGECEAKVVSETQSQRPETETAVKASSSNEWSNYFDLLITLSKTVTEVGYDLISAAEMLSVIKDKEFTIQQLCRGAVSYADVIKDLEDRLTILSEFHDDLVRVDMVRIIEHLTAEKTQEQVPNQRIMTRLTAEKNQEKLTD